MADTLLLTTPVWDWTVDSDGNWAALTETINPSVGYGARAQDAASECRLFLGEAYYDTTRGVPYWQQILGLWPPLSLVRSYLINAALLVPGVSSANVFFSSFADRTLSGQVQVTDASGTTQAANL